MPTRLDHEQGLVSAIATTMQYISIWRANLEQIQAEIAVNVEGIRAGHEVTIELAPGGAIDRLARRRELQKELDSLIRPYQVLEYEIDKLLAHLSRASTNVEAILGRGTGGVQG